MKSNKGEQVFSGNTDDILADKIIRHSKINSSKEESTIPERDRGDTSCCESFSTSQCVTVGIILFSLMVLLFMLLNRVMKTSRP